MHENGERNDMMKNDLALRISQEDSQRISILKLLMVIMVVFIHSYKTNINYAEEVVAYDVPLWFEIMKYGISEVLCRSAVPCFAFLSAYLLYRKPFTWKENITKKTKSILIPYFVLNAFWVVVYFICQHIPAVSSFFSNPETIVANWGLHGWISAFFGTPSDHTPMLAILWFLRDLFVVNLLAPVFDWIVRTLKYWALALFVLVWLFLRSTNIFCLNVQVLCFWGIGCCLARQRIALSSLDKYRPVISVTYLVLVILKILLRNQDGIWPLFVTRLCFLTGIAFWFVWATRIRGEKLHSRLLSLSRYGFCVYLFHEMTLSFLRKVFTRLLPQTLPFAMILYFGIPVVIILYCFALSYLLDRYVPRLYEIVSGGRRTNFFTASQP